MRMPETGNCRPWTPKLSLLRASGKRCFASPEHADANPLTGFQWRKAEHERALQVQQIQSRTLKRGLLRNGPEHPAMPVALIVGLPAAGVHASNVVCRLRISGSRRRPMAHMRPNVRKLK